MNQDPSENQNPLGFFLIIPEVVASDPDLPPAAILFFGRLTQLTQKEGYCWASNSYLAEICNVDESTIKRWLSSLHEKKYITIDTQKKGFQTNRKIYTYLSDFQKSSTKGQKCASRGVKNDPPRGSEMPPKQYKPNNIKKDNNQPPSGGGSETPSRVVIFPSLNSLNLDDEAKENISKHHKEDAVNLAVDRCLKWKGRPNDAVGVMTALRKADQWEDVPEKEDVIEKNKEWLKNHATMDGKTINNYQCQISPDYILFFGGAVSKAFKADNPNMVQEAMDWLKKKQ